MARRVVRLWAYYGRAWPGWVGCATGRSRANTRPSVQSATDPSAVFAAIRRIHARPIATVVRITDGRLHGRSVCAHHLQTASAQQEHAAPRSHVLHRDLTQDGEAQSVSTNH